MEPERGFRADLYRGTARYYDRFRPPYPALLISDLCRRLPVTGSGRLLDLACGTGQVAFALADRFAEVRAVDQEDELVAFGRAKSRRLGLTNLTWETAPAEELAIDRPVELITVGNAFHRLDRGLVAERMASWLRPGGGVALLWGDAPWSGAAPWQRALDDLLTAWTASSAATDRLPAGWQTAVELGPHDEVLRRAGFAYAGKYEFTVARAWTAEALAGFVYSTSFLNRAALGDRVGEFERDLNELMASLGPDGTLHESASYAYELARVPW